jgi:hypothetical protein
MGFKEISIDNYVQLHLKSNPSENKADLVSRPKNAPQDY